MAVALALSLVALVVSLTSPNTVRPVAPRGTAGAVGPDFYTQLGSLEARVDSQRTQQTIILTFVALLLTLSAAGFVMTERRAREIHSLAVRGESAAQARIAEAHQLAMRGEGSAQQRADEVHASFLQGSVQTLSLVNQTLELERVASQRAASAVERKAIDHRDALERAAKTLLSRVPSDDDHKLVTDEHLRGDLTSLARKTSGFESALFSVDVPLGAHSRFVIGMQLHLDEHFEDAFDVWEDVALDDRTDPDLRSLTWYWIGRERANLGHYLDAERAFEQALKDAPDTRAYEIKRVLIEVEFFDAEDYDAADLIGKLERLIAATESVDTDAAHRALPHMKSTLGNVHHEVALEHLERGERDQARAHFEASRDLFRAIAGEKWAVLGFAEALWWLGGEERTKGEALFANDGLTFARNEYVHRVEYRSKVMARSAELLCCARATDLRPEVDHVFQDVLDALGHVDGRMTVYSELQRRNVPKAAFQQDMEKLVRQSRDVPDGVEGSHGRN